MIRLPTALTDPFQAIGCRIGYLGPVSLHTPLWNRPRQPSRYTPHAWPAAARCGYCGADLRPTRRSPR